MCKDLAADQIPKEDSPLMSFEKLQLTLASLTPAQTAAALFVTVGGVVNAVARCRDRRVIKDFSSLPSRENEQPVEYDVVVVGGGPSGATAAYFAAKSGLRVLVFDAKKFPRVKPCGDAWCAPALTILEEMGVLQQMEADRVVHPVKRGGLISPFGYRCINTDGDAYGAVTGCKTYAIKREIGDNYLFKAAGAAGATLCDGFEVTACAFTEGDPGSWMISARDSSVGGEDAAAAPTKQVRARLLIIADGSTSYLAQKLGLLPQGSQPQAVSSTAYVKKAAWQEADGVMIFNRSMLPGYSALFRHYDSDVYIGTYVLPGGRATSRAIAPFETEAMEQHPYIRDALGPDYEWSRKRKVAPIRIGGMAKPYGRQVLLVGDSAGFVDPLTGEGIHTAMKSGKIAGHCVAEMVRKRNYSQQASHAYALRCEDDFGYEFWSSALAARVVYHLPIAIDAIAVVGQRRGQAFLDFFGEVMTGVRPKSAFFQPALLVDVALETLRQIVVQYVLRRPPLVPLDIGQATVDSQAEKKAASGTAATYA